MNDSDLDNLSYEEQSTKKRSLVWNFFERISRQRVQCRVCKHEQNYQGTTGNILRHLKARHSLDATLRGQQDPQNQKRIRELNEMITSGTIPVNINQTPIIKIRKRSTASESSDMNDPYNDNDSKQVNFENVAELQEDCIYNNDDREQDQKSSKKAKLEEDRILAETEYFREKAAYFRIQKHLTALQAKKVKLEIENFVVINKNVT